MTRIPDDLPSIFQAASSGALVLTATRRLARRLRTDFDRWMVESGTRAWNTPAIYSAEIWLKRSADVLGEGWRLLAPQTVRYLWERIIAGEESSGSVLLQISSTASAAEEAHRLLSEYGQSPEDFPLTADHLCFLRWREAYLRRCQDEGWIDNAALAEIVRAAAERGDLSAPSALFLLGFDNLPPRISRVAQAFERQGSTVHEVPLSGARAERIIRRPCADAREEVRHAARWARHLLEKGESGIGVVVPDLQGYRSLIERIFREEIDPEAQLYPGSEEVRFNLSLGEPLSSQGAIAAAMEILSAGFQLPIAQAGFLLRTPYLGGAEREAFVRATLDRILRKEGHPQVSLRRMGGKERLRKRDSERTSSLWEICEALIASLRHSQKRLPGAWAGHFSDLLQEVGWPGERPLDSLDYQVVKAWREKVLPQLAAFDQVSGPIERREALSLLRRLAAEAEFHPEGPQSPVQVTGLLEATGLDWQHLWIMGMHDGILPAAPRPNPFLPVSLQVRAGMPHASAEHEAHYAERIAARLCGAAPEVVFSHPLRSGDATLLPSPLIREFPVGEVDLAPSWAPSHLWQAAAPVQETFTDFSGPPLQRGERANGGTALLKDQALCPFRAFARHRLRAAALERPDIGLDFRERGNLLHKVMELFWKKTVSHAGLVTLGAQGVRTRVDACIEEASEVLYANRPAPPPDLLNLEKSRLSQLVSEWLLEVEMHRAPFTVLEEEKTRLQSFGGVEITIQVDRVDRLENGRRAVLDYKTGRVDPRDIVGDRLIEPQLPVYGLGPEGEDVCAVAFASLRRGECVFKGVAAESNLLPKVQGVQDWKKTAEMGIKGWEDLLKRWEEQLHGLGESFASGWAEVDPVNEIKACRYCDLAGLCRIAETASAGDEGEGE